MVESSKFVYQLKWSWIGKHDRLPFGSVDRVTFPNSDLKCFNAVKSSENRFHDFSLKVIDGSYHRKKVETSAAETLSPKEKPKC